MTSLLKLCVVLSVFVGTFAFGKEVAAPEVPLPNDLLIEKPVAEVPAACVRFYSETGWGQGKWNGTLPNQLWIEKINPDCSAQIVYAWGDSREMRVTAGYNRFSAQIFGNALRFAINERTFVSYVISEDGASLAGLWERGANRARITIKKMDAS